MAPKRRSALRVLAPLVLVAAIGTLVVLQRDVGKPHAFRPWPVSDNPKGTVDFGIVTGRLALNQYKQWADDGLQSVNVAEQKLRKHVRVVLWYVGWRQAPNLAQLRAIAARHSVPEITWEPWDYRKGLYAPQPKYSLRSIAAGQHDAYIASWARALASYGRPVRLRFAQEMNGNWYPWSGATRRSSPEQFVRAWRHVHDIFTRAGASNVTWVWSPVAIGVNPSFYPGDRYVDVVGMSGFNGGPQLKHGPWRTPRQLFAPTLDDIRRFAPRKPIELSEVGSSETGGDKAAWVAQLARWVRDERIATVIWFDVNKESNWGISSSARAQRAVSTMVAGREYR